MKATTKSISQDTKILFHYISYVQYPLMAVATYYYMQPFFNNLESIWIDFNKALMFFGIAVSFSTLQDTQKTQNKFSLRVWQNPKYAKLFLILIFFQILFFILFGIFGFFISENSAVKELSFGSILFGMGMIGLLKSAIEMAENHRKE